MSPAVHIGAAFARPCVVTSPRRTYALRVKLRCRQNVPRLSLMDRSCVLCRAKNKKAKHDPVAEGGSSEAEPIQEGPFGLKSSKQGQEEAPVNDQQIQNPTKEAAGHVLGNESASKLDRTLNKVENTMISTSDCALKDMVGTYEFNDEEKGVFRHLVSVMRRLAIGNFALAASTIIVTATKAARHRAEKIPFIVMRGFGISSIAYFLDALVAGGLVWMAAVSFKQANEAPPEQQLPHVFQGLMQVGVMFTQVTTITVCLSVVQSLEAAVRWPDIVLVAAVGCAVLAAVRTAAMGLVMAKYTPGSGKETMALMGMRNGKSEHIPWLDKAALTVVGGLLVPFSMPTSNPMQDAKKSSDHDSDGEGQDTKQGSKDDKDDSADEHEKGKGAKKDSRYTFSMTETTILEVVMDSMRTCALALALQALSTVLLGAAVILNGGVTDIFSFLTQFLEQAIRGSLLFSAASCFHEVVSSEGRDMKHLLTGLGKDRGMGLLFYRMQNVAISAAIFKTVDSAVVPLITRTALFKTVYYKVTKVIMSILPNAISNVIAGHF